MKAKAVGLIGGGVFAVVTWFTAEEFASKGAVDSGYKMDSTFVYMLDSARTIAGVPFKINSGFRTSEHNRIVGGVDGSAHTKGYAADIKCSNSLDRHKIVNALQAVGFDRIGIARTFVHVDNDPSKPQNVIWVY